MGKKGKTGKARLDKFYHLAKETGYRSRASFKLLQLNRQHGFLEKSRVCLDLCAAPGSWLQVAQQNMAMSSLIIGVDLVPIKSIPNVITLVGDITTEKCRASVKKELRDWQVDVVLNDGAPNVGRNWLHDAFQQAQLTLQAIRMATTCLRKGGWFVTKLFRSKDYHAVLWVINQLFKKVYATKPQASRNESAEIFVVCQGYLAPDKLDPKFTDPKYVFKDVKSEVKSAMDRLIHPDKKINKKAEGYEDGDYTLHHKVPVSKFLEAEDFITVLADSSQLVFDDEEIENHPLTTKEIKECLKDIKVLGQKDIRTLIGWRKKILNWRETLLAKDESKDEENKEVTEEEEVEEQMTRIKEEYTQKLKRKKKKVILEKKKLRDRITMGMVMPGDTIEQVDDIDLFDIKKIYSKSHLDSVEDADIDMAMSDDDDEDMTTRRQNMMYYDRFHDRENNMEDDLSDSDDYDDADDDVKEKKENDSDEESEAESNNEEDEDDSQNPLIIDLESKEEANKQKMDMWFNKASFSAIGEDDDDVEIEKSLKTSKKQTKENGQSSSTQESESDSGNSSDDDGDGHEDDDDKESSDDEHSPEDDDSDSDDSEDGVYNKMKNKAEKQAAKEDESHGVGDGGAFEVVPVQKPGKTKKLTTVGLAIGSEMIKSQKRRREIVEASFHRYTFNDDGLPSWFTKDEMKHCVKPPPVSQEAIRVIQEQNKAIDARPIKKVAEAKARKKKRSMKRMEKARKKAEAISDNTDVSDKEKMKSIKEIYKKAGALGNTKAQVTYLVAKRGAGKKVGRPKGVKGQFKVVDPRMKKDLLAEKKKLSSQKGRYKGTKRK